MVKTSPPSSPSPPPSSHRLKGIRKRSWGRWVSEIRLPHSRERIWLGSYSTAHQAARAYDAASICLRGSSASLNFPHLPYPRSSSSIPSKKEIQAIAAAAASDNITTTSIPFSSSSSSCRSDNEPGSPYSYPSPLSVFDFASVKCEEPTSDISGDVDHSQIASSCDFSDIFDDLNALAELPLESDLDSLLATDTTLQRSYFDLQFPEQYIWNADIL